MRIQLSDHFTYRKLLRFTLPSIVMMVFTSIYGVVDGLFVSNFVGKAVYGGESGDARCDDLRRPGLLCLATAAARSWQRPWARGRRDQANRYFTMIAIATVGTGIVISALGAAFMRPICRWLRADAEIIDDCVPLWPDPDGVQHGLYAAKCLPKLPDHGGKAEAGPACDDRCRGDEYGAGRCSLPGWLGRGQAPPLRQG